MSMLDTAAISEMLGLSVRHVRERIVNDPQFPRPAIQVSIKTRRWDLRDVNKWLESQRKKCAR